MHPDPERLARLPLLAALTPDELEAVARWSEVRHAELGERLTAEDAPGYTFFLLETGTASVTQDGVEVSELGPGDFFGEGAILGDGRRTATVTATAPATLVALFGTEFRRLEQELPAVAASIRGALAERLARTA